MTALPPTTSAPREPESDATAPAQDALVDLAHPLGRPPRLLSVAREVAAQPLLPLEDPPQLRRQVHAIPRAHVAAVDLADHSTHVPDIHGHDGQVAGERLAHRHRGSLAVGG